MYSDIVGMWTFILLGSILITVAFCLQHNSDSSLRWIARIFVIVGVLSWSYAAHQYSTGNPKTNDDLIVGGTYDIASVYGHGEGWSDVLMYGKLPNRQLQFYTILHSGALSMGSWHCIYNDKGQKVLTRSYEKPPQ